MGANDVGSRLWIRLYDCSYVPTRFQTGYCRSCRVSTSTVFMAVHLLDHWNDAYTELHSTLIFLRSCPDPILLVNAEPFLPVKLKSIHVAF